MPMQDVLHSQRRISDFFRRSAKAESADDSSGPAQSTAASSDERASTDTLGIVSSSPAIVQDALPSLEAAKRWLEASEQENGVLTSPQKRLKVAVDAISMSSCREQRELIQTLCGPHEWNIKQKERGQKRNIEQLRSALEREVVCFYGALKKKRTIAQMTAQARATEANVPNTATDHSDSSAMSTLPRIAASDCKLMHLPDKPFQVMSMVPNAAIEKLLHDEVVEQLENATFAFKQGVSADICVQKFLEAMPLSVNRESLINKHYPEYQHLLQNEDNPVAASGVAQPEGGP
jgi:hypothetical protein